MFKSKPPDPVTEAFNAIVGPFVIAGLIAGGLVVAVIGVIIVAALKFFGVI